MIRTYVHYSDCASYMVITIHARILTADKFFNSVQVDREAAERWVAKQYRDLYAETILHFIHHRRAAYRNFNHLNEVYEKALDTLEFRFERAQSIGLPELTKRVTISKDLFISIMPPEDSFWKNWRTTIHALLDECEFHHNKYQSKSYERTTREN